MCLHRRSNERCTSCSFTVQSVPHNMAGGYSSVDTVTFSSLCQCAMFLIMVLYNLCTLAYCSFYWDLTAFWQCVCFFCFFCFFSSIFAYFAVKLSICIQVHEDFSIFFLKTLNNHWAKTLGSYSFSKSYWIITTTSQCQELICVLLD